MTTLMTDISNYSGLIREGVLDRWYARGVRLITVQAIDPPPGFPPRVDTEQCDAIIADGRFALGIYGFHWTGTGLLEKNVSRIAALNYPVYAYFGDFEDNLTEAHPMVRANEIRDIMGWLAALESSRAPLSYTGKWWVDGYLPAGTTCMASYDQWLSFYDHVELINVQPVAGADAVAIKQHWGTLTFEGQPNCDLSVLSPQEEVKVLSYLGLISEGPAEEPPINDEPAPDPNRETPLDIPWPTWYEAYVNTKGIADELGRQLAEGRCARQPKGEE